MLNPIFRRRPRSSELITSWEELTAIAPAWDRLWRAGRSRRLCYSFRWVSEVTALFDRQRGTRTTPWCVVYPDRARPTAIAPLILSEGRLGKRIVRTFPDWVDRNHCFFSEGPVAPLAEEVRRHLHADGVDALFLRGVLRRSARELVAAWGGSRRCSARRISATEGESGAHGTTWWDRRAITLPDSHEAWLRTRSQSYRSSTRRAFKKAAGEGTLRYWRHSGGRQVCGDPLSVDELMAILGPIEARAWQGERHFVAGGDGRLILEVLGAEGMLELSLLFLNERPISYVLGHAANRAATTKYLGYDPDFAHLSPGAITLAELVRTSCEAGHLDEINLRGSTHQYKAQMADVIESGFELELLGTTARAALSGLARRVRDDGRRKQGDEARREVDEVDPDASAEGPAPLPQAPGAPG